VKINFFLIFWVIVLPTRISGIEGVKYLVASQEGIIKLLSEVGKIKDETVRVRLIRLYEVITSLWMYWNDSGDEVAAGDIEYYQKKFFSLLAEATRKNDKST